MKDGVGNQKAERTHGKRRADEGNNCVQPSSPLNLNSNKERIGSFGPKLLGEVRVRRVKVHSSVEEWHRASNALQERRAHSPQKPRPVVEANMGWERGVNLKGPVTTLGQEMDGKQPNSRKGFLRSEDSSAMGKGKSVLVVSSSQLRGSMTKFGSKKLWTSHISPISKCRQGAKTKRASNARDSIFRFCSPSKGRCFRSGNTDGAKV